MSFFPIQRYAGLDLGQRQDHSALALLEVCVPPTGPRDPYTGGFIRPIRFHLRHLERYPLGLTYPTLAAQVRAFLHQSQLKNCPLTLIVDATGPGLPFLDFFASSPFPASLIKLIITASGAPHYSEGYYHVSRQHLLANLASVLQNGTLKLAPKLPQLQNLNHELLHLQTNSKSTAKHDDLALAVALAAWQARKNHQVALATCPPKL